ncbi:DUF3011 domain-containing protein [Pseudaquabacterium pictum]|uniref:DUF3011 domain-containing protein n=1 Tax=Pseudaquabacterium pictum TaxID=2315236 RepID=A0A480AUB0_9BURK|nr:DUF3011 domain-containing protein [Rubrivivax pictus]GCL63335.1 hypothetical protein AQPW35_24160 [Rubrivivax pictus]
MRRFYHRLAAAAALLLLGGPALAASVTCQSRNNQREDCSLRGRGEVVLVRQISKTTCVKGRNWDETRQGLYVTDGCGGVFETRDGWNDRPGQGGGWGNGGHPNPGGPNGNGHGDLVGVRASSGESELQRRGYRETRNQSAPGGRFVFWRTPQRGCIEVRVADGRFQTIRPVNNSECDNGGRPPMPPDRPSHGGGRPQAPDPAMCMMQNSSQGATDGTIERSTEVRPGTWEFVIRMSGARFVCRTDNRGRVMSFNPG